MSIWKKALSTAASVAMLASLLVAGTASAAGPSASTGTGLTYLATCTPANCTQVADGLTQMQLQGPAAGGAAVPNAFGFMTVTGASFVSAAGHYSWVSSNPSQVSITGGPIVAGDTVSITSTTVGTAVITIWTRPDLTTPPTQAGTVSVTFVAAGTLNISAAKSSSKIVAFNATLATACTHDATLGFTSAAASSGAATAGANDGDLCVFVADGNGSGVAGANVSASTSPVGLVGGAQAVKLTEIGGGVYGAAISGSGVSGTATITITATNTASGTVALGSQSFIFVGDLATITASSYVSALNKANVAPQRAVSFKIFDAAKNRLDGAGFTFTGTVSAGAPFSVNAASTVAPTLTTSGQIWVICNGLEGKGTVTVSAKNAGGTTITSNAVTVYCSGLAASFTVAFDKAAVAPGGAATLTATSLDSAGQPAAGVDWAAFASSGNLYTGFNDGDQGDGTWTWSFLAPFQTGTVTAAVEDQNASVAGGYTNLGTKYATLIVGSAPAAAGTNASALGITRSGPFSASTKVAHLGKYETFKMTLGSSAAGKTVAILVAKKSSSGVWGSFTRLTSRVADASGNVYFYWRSSSTAWVSVRGSLDTMMTNAVQGRWR